MRRAHIRGALVGVESVTAEGLKAVFKDFNDAGEALVSKLQGFRQHGVHVLGSFIFGLPTDKTETFPLTAALAQRAGVSFAQFVMLQPLPGTVDFGKWEKDGSSAVTVGGVPLSRYWLIPSASGPRSTYRTRRCRWTTSAAGRRDVGRLRWPAALGALVVRDVAQVAAGVRAALEALSTDVPAPASRPTARESSDRPAVPACWPGSRGLFVAKPIPDLRVPGRPAGVARPMPCARGVADVWGGERGGAPETAEKIPQTENGAGGDAREDWTRSA
jgi:hypothetical protein